MERTSQKITEGARPQPGLRLSWAAVTIVLTAFGLLFGLSDRVRSQDKALIDEQIRALRTEVSLGREERLRNQQAIMTALHDQNATLDRRLTRMEARMDMIVERFRK